MSFNTLGLDPQLLKNVEELGYTVSTPIQKKAIPAVLEGRDVMGLAQTGTGKTAAFVLPLLQRLMTGPRRQLRVLIVGPTRELAQQTKDAIARLGQHTGLHCVAIYGGVGMRPQIDGVRHGAEIAIACPGRLLDHLRQGSFHLNHVECLVLDEADRMLDMGFLPDIRKILHRLPARRQTLLFAATMPDEIRRLAHEVLRDPVTIQIAHSKPAETVDHALYPVHQHLKAPLLLAILGKIDKGSVLVFTRTKQRARRLASQLVAAGYRSTSLQGNLSQHQRQAALDGFKAGRYQVLVATDLAARGIDVADISHVINFDMPNSVDDYTHRIGRTGRAAKTGDAFTLITHEDERVVRGIERVLNFRIERRSVEGFDYSAKPAPSAHPHHPGQPGGRGHAGGRRSFGSARHRHSRPRRPHRRSGSV